MTAHVPALDQSRTPRRAMISLDGLWQFRFETDEAWRQARVPAPWQACFEDLAVSFGTATYRRDFSLPADWKGVQIFLCFGAVSDRAIVLVNGTEIGRHEGGYLPFEVVIPGALLGAVNVLDVVAILPDAHRDGGSDFAEIPHGKQSWYGPQGGIWQSVRLEARDPLHISSVRLDPIWPEGRLDVRLELSADTSALVEFEITAADGTTIQRAEVDMFGGSLRHSIDLGDVEAWSPDAPHLYRVSTTLRTADARIDEWVEAIGFRRFEARGGYLHLNGAPLYLRGALDQDYYPDGFGTPPSIELLEDQFHKAKAMGLNCLRCHIKVPDPRYYDVADRLGMLIWTEIPNVETFTPASAARLRATMEDILARDRNHPSIIIWTLINEDWGTRRAAPVARWHGRLAEG